MFITFHKNTEPHCGAVGPIAYTNGEAWSVNVYPLASGPEKYKVMDWRFDLKYVPGCKECERHMAAAKEHKDG